MPTEYQNCIDSWKKIYPDYDFICWNEKNFNLSENSYCYQAFLNKKWAFVSDYVRLRVVYKYGGIYLDTDVETLKNINEINESFNAFFGYENDFIINTGLGFGAVPHHPIIKEMLNIYSQIQLDKDIPCPIWNTIGLMNCGYKLKKNRKEINYFKDSIILSKHLMNPKNRFNSKIIKKDNTVSIHHFNSSWVTQNTVKNLLKKIIPTIILDIRDNYLTKYKTYFYYFKLKRLKK